MSQPPKLSDWQQRHWVALATFTLLTLALYTLVDMGNRDGIDDWGHFYSALNGRVGYYSGRPLALFAQVLFAQVFGAQQLGSYIMLVATRIANGFLLYLIIDQLVRRSWFAYLVGLTYLLYVVPDWFWLGNVYSTSDHLVGVVIMQASLLLYIRSVRSSSWPLFLGAATLGLISIFIREPGLPLMAAVAVGVFAFDRVYTRERFLKLAAWGVVIAGGAAYYGLSILGITQRTYSSGYAEPFRPAIFIQRVLFQIEATLQPIFWLQAAKLNAYRLSLILVAIVLLVGLWAMVHFWQVPSEGRTEMARFAALWLGIGVTVWFLGLLAFLLTNIGETIQRVHSIAPLGTAIALASLIVLLVQVLPTRWLQSVGAVSLLAVIAAVSVVQMGESQIDYYLLDTVWTDQAELFRPMTHAVPTVKEDTLILFLEQDDRHPVPYLVGTGFDFSVRYFYQGNAVGVVSNNALVVASWALEAEGIRLTSNSPLAGGVLYTNRFYGWDEMIVVTRDDDTLTYVAPELTTELLSKGLFLPNVDLAVVDETSLQTYDPYARIEAEYVNRRVQQVHPSIQPLP